MRKGEAISTKIYLEEMQISSDNGKNVRMIGLDNVRLM